MSERRINLADPDFEPTDEELAGLMQRAFADLRSKNERTLAYVREQIAVQRGLALKQLAESKGKL